MLVFLTYVYHSARYRECKKKKKMICTLPEEWGEPDLPAAWSHLDLSDLVPKEQNNGVKVCGHRRLKSPTSGL